MKNLITKTGILLMVYLVVVSLTFAQNKNDIFDKNAKIMWLGLDFTGAKLIGDRERLGTESDIKHLLESWNTVIINEPNKYDIAAAIDKVKLENAIEVTLENNADLDVTTMYSDDPKDYLHLNQALIEHIVKGYDFGKLKGIGLMFNIEGFSKLNQEASLWVTFIDMGRKQVIFTERITGKPAGFGMRNFWAGAIYKVLERMKKKEFEMWRKKYYRA